MFVKDDLKQLVMFALKSLIVFALVILVPIFIIFSAAVFSTAFYGIEDDGENEVYIVDLNGAIQEGSGDFMTAGISPGLVENRLNEVKERGAEAVVLRINSPGGAIAASQETADIIDRFDLPVVVSMADVAASGGYYISAPADHILANPGTRAGGIGVISAIINMDGLYEKLGIEVEIIKSGEFKGMGMEGLSEKERQKIQEMSDEFYEQFVGDMAEYRQMDFEKVYELATGEVFSGNRAEELGLVDGVGGLNDAVNKAGEIAGIEDPQSQRLESPGLFEQLFNIYNGLPQILDRYLTPEKLQYLDEYEENLPVEFKYKYSF